MDKSWMPKFVFEPYQCKNGSGCLANMLKMTILKYCFTNECLVC